MQKEHEKSMSSSQRRDIASPHRDVRFARRDIASPHCDIMCDVSTLGEGSCSMVVTTVFHGRDYDPRK